jgi:hypothetical protein
MSGREVEEESAVNVAWKNFCAGAGNFRKPREIKGAGPGRRGVRNSVGAVAMFEAVACLSRFIVFLS